MKIKKINVVFAAALVVLIAAVAYNTKNKTPNTQLSVTPNSNGEDQSLPPSTSSTLTQNGGLQGQGVLPRGEPPGRPEGGQVAGVRTDDPFDLHKGMTFQQAMDAFRDGYKFQFTSCHGMPGRYIVTTQTRFMLDNRDGTRHDFGIAGVTVTIPAYDFLITSIKDPGYYMITCDGGGAAELVVVQ